MLNSKMAEVLYIFGLVSVLVFLYFLFKAFNNAKVPFSLRKVANFTIHEIFAGVSSLTGFIHLSVVMGIVLSTLYLCVGPLLLMNSFIWYALLIISLPFVAGLLIDIIWRVSVLSKGLTVFEHLKVTRDFKRESMISQTKVMIIVILTLGNMLLLWNLESNTINYLIFIIRNLLLSITFVKPVANTLLNYDKPIHYFETPFKLKDVMDGRAEIRNIKIGVENINDLSDRKKLSLDACLEIGACDDVCPALAVLRPLSPRVLIRKLSILLKKKPPDGNPFEVIEKDELWSCTMCGACTYSCPINVRHLEIILDLRRTLVESGLIDEKKSKILSNVSRYGNTFGMSNYGRNKWLEKLGVKSVDQNPNCKYLLWVGCLSSFDDRLRKIVEAFIKILEHVGRADEIAILGNLETCCGDPVRKLGDEGLYQEIVLKNIELFERYNIRAIITACPHCYNSFKNEYPELGLKDVKVIHHTEFLETLFQSEAPNLKVIDKKMIVHDPCYLSRYNRINPRVNTLKRTGNVVRPERCGEKTYCCGGGGGNYWYEVPEKKRISHERLEQLIKFNPDIIITFCPYCKAMLNDAAQVKELEMLQILDVAELISEAIE